MHEESGLSVALQLLIRTNLQTDPVLCYSAITLTLA